MPIWSWSLNSTYVEWPASRLYNFEKHKITHIFQAVEKRKSLPLSKIKNRPPSPHRSTRSSVTIVTEVRESSSAAYKHSLFAFRQNLTRTDSLQSHFVLSSPYVSFLFFFTNISPSLAISRSPFSLTHVWSCYFPFKNVYSSVISSLTSPLSNLMTFQFMTVYLSTHFIPVFLRCLPLHLSYRPVPLSTTHVLYFNF